MGEKAMMKILTRSAIVGGKSAPLPLGTVLHHNIPLLLYHNLHVVVGVVSMGIGVLVPPEQHWLN